MTTQEEWPLLIIVPASLRLVWAEELEKWLPHLRPSSIHVIEGKSDRVQGSALPPVCITSYEMMQRLTCDACKGSDGRPVALAACAGSQVGLSVRGVSLCSGPAVGVRVIHTCLSPTICHGGGIVVLCCMCVSEAE